MVAPPVLSGPGIDSREVDLTAFPLRLLPSP